MAAPPKDSPLELRDFEYTLERGNSITESDINRFCYRCDFRDVREVCDSATQQRSASHNYCPSSDMKGISVTTTMDTIQIGQVKYNRFDRQHIDNEIRRQKGEEPYPLL